jgi:hypothetical protein
MEPIIFTDKHFFSSLPIAQHLQFLLFGSMKNIFAEMKRWDEIIKEKMCITFAATKFSTLPLCLLA